MLHLARCHSDDLYRSRRISARALGVHLHGNGTVVLDAIERQLGVHLRGYRRIVHVDLDEAIRLGAGHVLAVFVTHVVFLVDGDHFHATSGLTVDHFSGVARQFDRDHCAGIGAIVLGVDLLLFGLERIAHRSGDTGGSGCAVGVRRLGGIGRHHALMGGHVEGERLVGRRAALDGLLAVLAGHQHIIGILARGEGEPFPGRTHFLDDDPVIALGEGVGHIVAALFGGRGHAAQYHRLVGRQGEVLQHHVARHADHIDDDRIAEAVGVHLHDHFAVIVDRVGVQIVVIVGSFDGTTDLRLHAAGHHVGELHAVEVAVAVVVGDKLADEVLVVLEGRGILAADNAAMVAIMLAGVVVAAHRPAGMGVLGAVLAIVEALGLVVRNAGALRGRGRGDEAARGGQPRLPHVQARLGPHERCGRLPAAVVGGGVHAGLHHIGVPVAHVAMTVGERRRTVGVVVLRRPIAAAGVGGIVAVVPPDVMGVIGQLRFRRAFGAGLRARRVADRLLVVGGLHVGIEEVADGSGVASRRAVDVGMVVDAVAVGAVGIGIAAHAVDAPVVHVPARPVMTVGGGLAGNVRIGAVEHLPGVGLLGLVAGEGRIQHQVVHIHEDVVGAHGESAPGVVQSLGAVERVDAARPVIGIGRVVGVVVLAHPREVRRLQPRRAAPGLQAVAGDAVALVHLGQVVHRGVHVEVQLDAVAHFHARRIGHDRIHGAIVLEALIHNGAAARAVGPLGAVTAVGRLGRPFGQRCVNGNPRDLEQGERRVLARAHRARIKRREVVAVAAHHRHVGGALAIASRGVVVVVDHGTAVVGQRVVGHGLDDELHAVGALSVDVLIGVLHRAGLHVVEVLVPAHVHMIGQPLGRDDAVLLVLQVLGGDHLVEHRIVQLTLKGSHTGVRVLGNVLQSVLVPQLLAGHVTRLLCGIGIIGRLRLIGRLEYLVLELHDGGAAPHRGALALALILLGQIEPMRHRRVALEHRYRRRRLRHIHEIEGGVLLIGVGKGHVHLAVGRPQVLLLAGGVVDRRRAETSVLVASHAKQRHVIERESHVALSHSWDIVVGPTHADHVAEHIAVGRMALRRERGPVAGHRRVAYRIARLQILVAHPRAHGRCSRHRADSRHDGLALLEGSGGRRRGLVPIGHVVLDLHGGTTVGRPRADALTRQVFRCRQKRVAASHSRRPVVQAQTLGRCRAVPSNLARHGLGGIAQLGDGLISDIGGLARQLEVALAGRVTVGVEAYGAVAVGTLGDAKAAHRAHKGHRHCHGGLVPGGVANVRHTQAHAVAIGIGPLARGGQRIQLARLPIVILGRDSDTIHVGVGVLDLFLMVVEDHVRVIVSRQLVESVEAHGAAVGLGDEAVPQLGRAIGDAIVRRARAGAVGAPDIADLTAIAGEVSRRLVVTALGPGRVVVDAILAVAVQRCGHSIEIGPKRPALVARIVGAVGLVLLVVVGPVGLQLVGHLGDDANPHAATGIDLACGIAVVLRGSVSFSDGEHEVAVVVILFRAVDLGEVDLRFHRIGHGAIGVGEPRRHGQGRATAAGGGVVLHPFVPSRVEVLLHFPANDALADAHLEAGIHVLEGQSVQGETAAGIVGEIGAHLAVGALTGRHTGTHVQAVLHVIAGVQVTIGDVAAIGARGGVGGIGPGRRHRGAVGIIGEDSLLGAVQHHLLAALHIGGKRAQTMRQIVTALVVLVTHEGILVRVAREHVGHRQVVVHGHAAEAIALLVEGGRRPVIPVAPRGVVARLGGRAEVGHLAVGVDAIVGEGEVVLPVGVVARLPGGAEPLAGVEHGLRLLAIGLRRHKQELRARHVGRCVGEIYRGVVSEGSSQGVGAVHSAVVAHDAGLNLVEDGLFGISLGLAVGQFIAGQIQAQEAEQLVIALAGVGPLDFGHTQVLLHVDDVAIRIHRALAPIAGEGGGGAGAGHRAGQDAQMNHVLPGQLHRGGRVVHAVAHRAHGELEVLGAEPGVHAVMAAHGHELLGHVDLLHANGIGVARRGKRRVPARAQAHLADMGRAVLVVDALVLVVVVAEARLVAHDVGREVIGLVIGNVGMPRVVIGRARRVHAQVRVVLEGNEIAQEPGGIAVAMGDAGVGRAAPVVDALVHAGGIGGRVIVDALGEGARRRIVVLEVVGPGAHVVTGIGHIAAALMLRRALEGRVLLPLVNVGTAEQLDVDILIAAVAIDHEILGLGGDVAVAVVGTEIHRIGGDELVGVQRDDDHVAAVGQLVVLDDLVRFLVRTLELDIAAGARGAGSGQEREAVVGHLVPRRAVLQIQAVAGEAERATCVCLLLEDGEAVGVLILGGSPLAGHKGDGGPVVGAQVIEHAPLHAKAGGEEAVVAQILIGLAPGHGVAQSYLVVEGRVIPAPIVGPVGVVTPRARVGLIAGVEAPVHRMAIEGRREVHIAAEKRVARAADVVVVVVQLGLIGAAPVDALHGVVAIDAGHHVGAAAQMAHVGYAVVMVPVVSGAVVVLEGPARGEAILVVIERGVGGVVVSALVLGVRAH